MTIQDAKTVSDEIEKGHCYFQRVNFTPVLE